MPMKKSAYIWMDGQFVPWDQAQIHVMSHVLHYGSSVFEGIRAYSTPDGPAILALDPHVRRLFNSCKIYRMEVPYTVEAIRAAIVETVHRNGHESCYIRPLVYRGYDSIGVEPRTNPVKVAIAAIEWGRYLGAEALEQGVDVGVSSWRRMAPDTFPAMAKIGGQYINSQFIAMEAHDHGYTEGIALDINGYVSEGPGENLFLVLDGTVYTPPLSGSILAGCTRTMAIQLLRDLGFLVVEQTIPREMLYIVDELFFTGTAAEITPIRSVDGQAIGTGRRGPVTEKVQNGFFDIVEGRVPDRFGWLTPVHAAEPAPAD
ncbi:MAG: branched-chain amino acid transaminase [Ardenticatenaceae bacterium]|nr:branched-chain amino acid transaminase [Ardenticatenaceae bacterium]HBY99265.1 branched chain amino acid aminotransferase [Chloroflexota bacterium]